MLQLERYYNFKNYGRICGMDDPEYHWLDKKHQRQLKNSPGTNIDGPTVLGLLEI
jgi:hypothetical protein